MDNIRWYAKLIGVVVVTAAAVGVFANLNDIRRYIRISTM
jgi:hypothetical protein